MKVLVCVARLGIGGTQLNAIDLASALQHRGHEVAVVAPAPGPLATNVADRGVRLILLDQQPAHPLSGRTAWKLGRVAAAEGADLVHAWSTPTSLEAFFGAHVLHGVPLLASIMSMVVPERFPKSVPLIVGTRFLEEQARARARPAPVFLIEPPVDTDRDHPGVEARDFLQHDSLLPDCLRIVIVSRLDFAMKLEGLERLVDATAELAHEFRIQLIIVGGGPAQATLQQRADMVNSHLGQRAVLLMGPMVDPGPAYAAADVVVGMGGSILRGMAFGKPAVVVGEAGFSAIVSPSTSDYFLRNGFWGVGQSSDETTTLLAQLRTLLEDPDRRTQLGGFGRQLVLQHYNLSSAAAMLESIYQTVVYDAAHRSGALEVSRTMTWVVGFKAKSRTTRAVRRIRSTIASPAGA